MKSDINLKKRVQKPKKVKKAPPLLLNNGTMLSLRAGFFSTFWGFYPTHSKISHKYEIKPNVQAWIVRFRAVH